MGSLGTLASRYCVNVQSLEEFDQALSVLISQKKLDEGSRSMAAVTTILEVLRPIGQSMYRRLSTTMSVDDYEVVHILHKRHASSWQDYSNQVQNLVGKLQTLNNTLSRGDISILNDVADALDVQCTHLLNRMSGY